MKRILMTTAIVAAMGSAAIADTSQQSTQNGSDQSQAQMSADAQGGASGKIFAKDISAASVKGDIMASALMGKDIYIPKADASAKGGDPMANLDDVGQVGDVILTKEGKVDAVLVDVGGFLGMGAHTVALDWSGLQWKMKPDAKSSSDSYIVVNASKKQLENAPAFKKSWLEKTADASKSMANSAATTASNAADSAKQSMSKAADKTKQAASNAADSTKQAMSDATDKAKQKMDTKSNQSADASNQSSGQSSAKTSGSAQANASANASAPGSAMAKAQADGYTEAKTGAVASTKLTGATVYDAKGNDIGEVSKLIVDPNSKDVKGAVIDVGGFLGLGQKPVELTMDQMHVMTKKNGNDVRIYVSQTEKQLKQMPTYKSKG